jgi:hypothetical protein
MEIDLPYSSNHHRWLECSASKHQLPYIQPTLTLSTVLFFLPLSHCDTHIFVGTAQPAFSAPRHLIYISPCGMYHHPISLSTPLTHCPSALQTFAIFERALGGSQRGAMVGKAHLLDHAAHEVPLPLFGLGYGWACTFRGAPLPLLGQA